jgi:dihydroorotase
MDVEHCKAAGFEGIFYAYHVTCPESVQVIEHYRKICDFPIVCGATPHGLLITTDDMEGREGLRYKANPPVRDPSTVKGMRKELKEGKIDFIESDHAPHTHEEKFLLGEKCLSGYTSYDSYPDLMAKLPEWGLTESQIMDLTFRNAQRVFKGKITE